MPSLDAAAIAAVVIALFAAFVNGEAETFRRICMSFDSWVVGFGLSRVLIELHLVASPWAYSFMALAVLIDAWLLYVFFVQRAASRRSPTLP